MTGHWTFSTGKGLWAHVACAMHIFMHFYMEKTPILSAEEGTNKEVKF